MADFGSGVWRRRSVPDEANLKKLVRKHSMWHLSKCCTQIKHSKPKASRAWLCRGVRVNPIDHIFQFHKALRADLNQLEAEAANFANIVDEADPATLPRILCQLEGRFRWAGQSKINLVSLPLVDWGALVAWSSAN